MKKALVTIVIGDEYRTRWQQAFAPALVSYARRHGYELIAVDHYIDTGDLGRMRSPHWQKCLILDLPGICDFDRVVWMDADILVNYAHAPDIVAQVPEGRIGAVSHVGQYRRWPSVADASEHRFYDYLRDVMDIDEGHRGDPVARYRLAGLPQGPTDLLNTGVLVLDPARDRDLMRSVYLNGRENRHSLFENMPLSHALLSSGRVSFIDEGFNVVYAYELCAHYPWVLFPDATEAERRLAVNAIWSRSYFLHFTAGSLRRHVDLVDVARPGLAGVSAIVAEGRA